MHAPVIILTSFFTLKVIGFYSFAQRILSLPIGLIAVSIGQVFFQEMSEKKLLNDRVILFEKTLFKLLKLAAPLFAFIMIFGDSIFSFIFCEEWIIAGEYAQIISLWLFFVFLISPLTQLYNILVEKIVFLKQRPKRRRRHASFRRGFIRGRNFEHDVFLAWLGADCQ